MIGEEEKQVTISLRVTVKERMAMREMAKVLGFEKKGSGDSNLGAYLRAAHSVMVQMYEQDALRPSPPIVVAQGGRE